MSIPLTTVEHYGSVFVHKGGKLENRQFLAKMHQITPNCVSNFKIFPGMTPRTPHLGRPQTLPARRFAPRLVAFGHSIIPPDSFILPLNRIGWIKPCN